jgi:formylglycine-generating enzyme required for sulfatase activity
VEDCFMPYDGAKADSAAVSAYPDASAWIDAVQRLYLREVAEPVPDEALKSCVGRVARGGSFVSAPAQVRSANRGVNPPDTKMWDLGFRVARTIS